MDWFCIIEGLNLGLIFSASLKYIEVKIYVEGSHGYYLSF